MEELRIIYEMLVGILGKPKNPPDARSLATGKGNLQLQFGCPDCIDRKGPMEAMKFNLELSLSRMQWRCWSCENEGIGESSGSILGLFKKYGGREMERRCAELLRQMRASEMYSLTFGTSIETAIVDSDDLKLPYPTYFIKNEKHIPFDVMRYLEGRRINDKIIDRWNLGYTMYVKDKPMYSNRIIVPSYQNELINYWTGRDFTDRSKQKYANCPADRKSTVFGYDNIDWDGDLVLCEGPFDALALPYGQAIPMLGKVVKQGYKLYDELFKRFNGNTITLFFDSDVNPFYIKETYKSLNHDRLRGKIRYVPMNSGSKLDASLIYQLWGADGILKFLRSATTISEAWL